MIIALTPRVSFPESSHGRAITHCMPNVSRLMRATVLSLAAAFPYMNSSHAVTIDWVTAGDPGNTADTTGYGAVAYSFQIMKFEFTNQQYSDFLNAVDPDGTNPNSVYNANMGTNPRGGISFNSPLAAGVKYAVRTDMGDKPVNYVSWFDAARVSNWLHSGTQSYGSTDSSATAPQNTGAYTVGTATDGNGVAKNSGALFYIPTENEWYKAAYYKGGSTNAGYWAYATQSDTDPTAVTAGPTGIGSAGSAGNFANFNSVADWNGEDGNVTTVGTNGGPSFYGTFDMGCNLWELNDLDGTASSSRGRRGGRWYYSSASDLSSSTHNTVGTDISVHDGGFRLASPVPVPEPSTVALAAIGIAGAGLAFRRRQLARRSS
jgi:formylglycine-generating enzyme